MTKPKTVAEQSVVVAEIMHPESRFDREALSSIISFDDAIRAATEQHGSVVSIADTELSDGFRVATEDDKRRLCGVPLVFIEWDFRSGDYGDFYVSVRALSQGENGVATKWIINDGGVGVAADLKSFTEKTGRYGGLVVPRGLRVSDYYWDPDSGTVLNKREYAQALVDGRKPQPGSTFYLDTSA